MASFADYQATQRGQDELRFLTCGSVDDGKSTLIGRLLLDTASVFDDQLAALRLASQHHGAPHGDIDPALVTDGLDAEREQGITIDVAYRHFSTRKRTFLVADTPGHTQYTRNMATGASHCQAAVILVDVTRGISEQTLRHWAIVSLLGISHVVIAINKMDLVAWRHEAFEAIAARIRELAHRFDVPPPACIPVSGRFGDNIGTSSANMPWYAGATLLHFLETIPVQLTPPGAALRLPVQYVLRPADGARVYCGTIASGALRAGEELLLLPAGTKSNVASLRVAGTEATAAAAGDAVAFALVTECDLSRGDMVVHAAAPPPTLDTFEADLVWLGTEPLTPGQSYWLKHTTRTVRARVLEVTSKLDLATRQATVADGALACNEIGRAVLTCASPIFADPYHTNRETGSFILIHPLSNETIAGGMIRDAVAAAGRSWALPTDFIGIWTFQDADDPRFVMWLAITADGHGVASAAHVPPGRPTLPARLICQRVALGDATSGGAAWALCDADASGARWDAVLQQGRLVLQEATSAPAAMLAFEKVHA